MKKNWWFAVLAGCCAVVSWLVPASTQAAQYLPQALMNEEGKGLAMELDTLATFRMSQNRLAMVEEYEVQPGDTLYRIAQNYNVPLDELIRWNQITNPSLLRAGESIEVPRMLQLVYVTKPGDTLDTIARRLAVDVEELRRLNGLTEQSEVADGYVLRLPMRPEVVARLNENATNRQTMGENHLERRALSSRSRPAFGRYLGQFTLTAYTAGPESTGKSPGHPAYGITASGAYVEEGTTIAVDPRIIPMGSRVYIEGIGYRVAQDTGGAIKGRRIDVYMEDLEEALKFGVKKNVAVYLVE